MTGWFSEFSKLADDRLPHGVRYGAGPARFAGSTFDPTSAYRGAAVLDFFDENGLGPDFLRRVSLHQVGLLLDTFRELDLDPEVVRPASEVAPERRGGFLALRARDAKGVFEGLLERGVRTDYRGDVLRFGPAPYLSDRQLVTAMETLGDVVGD